MEMVSYLISRKKEILTVKRAPPPMSVKLKLCCVVLATFSVVLRSPHFTRPSSLKTVTLLCFCFEVPGAVVPRLVCVAYARTQLAQLPERLEMCAGKYFNIV